jgi:signal transduction histidine kinase
MRLRDVSRWIAIVRLIAVPFAVFQVASSSSFPDGYERRAWIATAVLAAGAVVLFVVSRLRLSPRAALADDLLATAFDFAIVAAFVLIYHYAAGTPTRQLLFLPLVEGAVRFGIAGALAVALASVPVALVHEELRSDRFHVPYQWNYVTFQVGVELLIALIIGWLVRRLVHESREAQARAVEAEELRDELGRRADLLDAANRCARALSSSLELDEAFGAFIRELRGLVPFNRMAIVLAEEGGARVIATSGESAGDVMPPGALLPLERNLLADVVERGQTIYREDLAERRYAEEQTLLDLGVRSRVAAPLLVGARTIGLLSVGRPEPNAFSAHEVELVSLLGRLVASAVQNIRAYESERRTVEELRKLSALRSDFVSLVSHEMRSPMAAVIGSARTLQQRWRELSSEHRDSFLALIANETDRLANLIGDVLDTSRIDAGTFTYTFADVAIGDLVEEAVSAARLGQDAIPITTRVAPDLPSVRGDPARLRQVLSNLIDNAVKYSPDGQAVEVHAHTFDSRVVVDVSDRGEGIAPEQQRVIFEKFGRARGAQSKPGTGLGLYIARSITEAHGGTLQVASVPGRGSTFTLSLPAA